jgi:hypothetical protein
LSFNCRLRSAGRKAWLDGVCGEVAAGMGTLDTADPALHVTAAAAAAAKMI